MGFTPDTHFGVDINENIIPIDVSASARLLWILNISAGLGIDLTFGRSDVVTGSTSGMKVYSGPDKNNLTPVTLTTEGKAVVDAGTNGKPSFANFRVSAGLGMIMAAFTHVNAAGSRFSDGRHGMFYAARDRATAIAETRHHHARFLAATAQPAMHLPMRLYHVAIDARLHDLRPPAAVDAAVYDPADYTAAQALGARLRAAGSAGVVYRSVRQAGGQCVGLFSPLGARDCLHAAHLLYAWDGRGFADVYEKLD